MGDVEVCALTVHGTFHPKNPNFEVLDLERSSFSSFCQPCSALLPCTPLAVRRCCMVGVFTSQQFLTFSS